MSLTAIKRRPRKQDPADIVRVYIQQGASPNTLTWVVLGGVKFMPQSPVSTMDYLTASRKGIRKLSLIYLADVMHVPMKDMAHLLNVSYKTIGRKKETDLLDSLVSSLSIEIANTVARGLSVFGSTEKLNRWLQKENRALDNQKPFDLLNMPTGIKTINSIIGRIEEGVYT